MFNFFKKNPQNLPAKPDLAPPDKFPISNIQLKLSGLHCSSCAVNIDLSLEDLDGVISSKTNYAKSCATVDFEPDKIDPKEIIAEITKLGYQAETLG